MGRRVARVGVAAEPSLGEIEKVQAGAGMAELRGGLAGRSHQAGSSCAVCIQNSCVLRVYIYYIGQLLTHMTYDLSPAVHKCVGAAGAGEENR